MATDVELDRVLAVLTATLNDQRLEEFDPEHVQQIVTEMVGEDAALTVDAGGGLHDESGVRVGAVRRTPSGEWITERQRETAEHSDVAIPAAQSERTAHKLLGKLKGDS